MLLQRKHGSTLTSTRSKLTSIVSKLASIRSKLASIGSKLASIVSKLASTRSKLASLGSKLTATVSKPASIRRGTRFARKQTRCSWKRYQLRPKARNQVERPRPITATRDTVEWPPRTVVNKPNIAALLQHGERSFRNGNRDELWVAGGGGERIRDDRHGYVLIGEIDEITLEAINCAGVRHGPTPQDFLHHYAERVRVRSEGVVFEGYGGDHRRVRIRQHGVAGCEKVRPASKIGRGGAKRTGRPDNRRVPRPQPHPRACEQAVTFRQRQVRRSAHAGGDEPERQREFIMDEIGERPARDRFDRIAEQHVAGAAVTPRLAGREIERLPVDGLDGLFTRDRQTEVERGREPVATNSRRVAEEVPQCDFRASGVELRYEFLDAIVQRQSSALGEAENRRCREFLRDRADLEHRSRRNS